MSKCIKCEYYKFVDDKLKTAQDLLNQIKVNGQILASCTLGDVCKMYYYENCRFTEEEFNKLESK